MNELNEKERKLFHDFHSKLASIDAAVKMIKRGLSTQKHDLIAEYTPPIDQALSELKRKWDEIKEKCQNERLSPKD